MNEPSSSTRPWATFISGAIALGVIAVVGRALGARSRSYAPPFDWDVPFARPNGKIWPVVSSSGDDDRRYIVAYKAANGTIINDDRKDVSGSRYFGAPRENKTRRHAGIDLVAHAGDPIVAMEDGIVVQSIPGYVGLDAVVVEHGPLAIVYAEFAKDPHIVPGMKLEKGMRIGEAATSSSGTELHVETWDKDHAPTSYTPWYASKGAPEGLYDPTIYLLELARKSS